jgi:hypothetical protein
VFSPLLESALWLRCSARRASNKSEIDGSNIIDQFMTTPAVKTAIPSIKWFEFVTGLSEPEFIRRRSEVIQPLHSSSNLLHGVDIGPSLQIRSAIN